MRRPLIAGNWKMNLNRADSVTLAQSLVDANLDSEVDVMIAPPFVYLDAVNESISRSRIALGSQDAYFEPEGAFTGEINSSMLVDVGCSFVILGHSERRHVLGETDQTVNQKLHAVLSAGLTPIVCVGELLEHREAGQTAEIIKTQFEASLAGLSNDQILKIVIAYEPVWAIGTGKTATPQQAQEVHADLRNMVANEYNPGASETVRILYGGSVKPENTADLMSQPDIDGALVGGAALKSDSFISIINSTRGDA